MMKTLILFFLSLSALASETTNKPITVSNSKSVYNGELTVIDFNQNRYLIAKSRQTTMLQGMMNLLDNQSLDTEVPQVMTALTALHPSPKSIFTLGLGGGSIVRYHLKKYAKLKILSAEIDSEIVSLSGKFFNTNLPNHKIETGDGYTVLKNHNQEFDVIWVDTGLPKSGPKVTVKAEEVQALKGALQKNGILIIYLGEAKAESIYDQAIASYKGDFSNAILVKTNSTLLNQKLNSLHEANNELNFTTSDLPIYFLAVGNNEKLKCDGFNKELKRLINLKKSEIELKSGICLIK